MIYTSSIFLTRIIAQATPFFVQKNINEYILQFFLQEAINDDDLNCLLDKIVRIHIKDISHNITLTLKNNTIEIIDNQQKPDTKISGNLRSFIQLATRRQDPDTLFFQRELSIEGNTELGLTIKNIIDSLEFTNLPFWLHTFINGVQKIESRMTPNKI